MGSSLPREAKLFGAVSFLNDFASEMVYPLLPALLTGMGAGPVVLGALDGTADFASAVVKVGAGRLADRPSRRGPLVIIGYAIAVFVRPLIALAHAAAPVIGLRIVDRFGKGIRAAPRDAIIADATLETHRGRAFGLQRGLDNLGAVAGPLIAWALLSSGKVDERGVIAASIVPGVLVLILATLAVWGTRAARGPAAGAGGGWALPAPVAMVAAFSFFRIPDALLLLRVQQLGASVATIALLWAAVSGTRAIGSFVGGALSDRWGAAKTLGAGWLAYVAAGAALALAQVTWHGWAAFIAVGVVLGILEGPERAFVARLGAGRQGSAFGGYHGAQGLAALAGGLVLGFLYQRAGPGVACGVSAAGVAALRLVWKPST